MEHESSLPYSQVPATCPYPEPARSSPCPHVPLPKIYLNIILPFTSGLFKWSVSLRFPRQNPVHASCLTHLILLDFITRTILGEQYRSLSSSLCSFFHSPVASSLLGPNFLLNTLFSYTLSLCSSLDVSDQFSHPYKTTSKITILYIFIFKLLDIQLEDKRFCTEG